MKLLITILVLASCNNQKQYDNPKSVNEMEMVCEKVGDFMYRCENAEVVCYKYFTYNIQCHFKEVQI